MKIFFCSPDNEDTGGPDIFKELDEHKQRSSLLLSDTTIFKRYKLKIEKIIMLKEQQEKKIKFSVENQETEYIVKLEREFDNFELYPNFLENNYLFVDDIKIEIENLNGKKEIIIEDMFKINLNLEICFVKEKVFSFEKSSENFSFKDHSSNEFHLIFKNLEEKSSVESIKEYENSSSVLFTGYDFIECLNHDLFVSTYEISFLFKFKLSDELKDLPLWTTNEKEVIISTFYCSIIQKNNVEISTKDETNKDDFLFQLNQVYKKNDWNTKIVTYSSSTLKEYYNGILFSNLKIDNSQPIKDTINFCIGALNDVDFIGFRGLISNIQIFNYVLSKEEIQKI
eukprot:gene8194-22_t